MFDKTPCVKYMFALNKYFKVMVLRILTSLLEIVKKKVCSYILYTYVMYMWKKAFEGK